MSGADLSLRNYLIDTGLLSRSQIDAALIGREEKPFSLAIVESGSISEDELRRASAHSLGIPFVTLGRSDISLTSLMFIPEPLSRTANVIAYAHTEEGIEVALLDLADLPSIEFLRNQYRVQVRLTDRGSIKQGLLLYQKYLKEKFAGLVHSGKEAVDALLKHALHSGAQYIHLEPASAEAAGIIVRYRIEGALREAMRLPASAGAYIVEQLKHLGKLFPVTGTSQEGSFSFLHNDEEVGVGLNTTPTTNGERLTMRLARHKTGVAGFSLQTLGLHGEALERVHSVLQNKKGAVLVAGGEKSGKTTVLYTLLDQIAGVHLSIATVEDQVKYRMGHAHQATVRPDLGLTVPSLLRSVLRQDPDVVMVSDISGEGSAQLLFSAAERGVFMLGGVSGESAAGAIGALQGTGISPLLIAVNTKLIIAQQVLHKLCPHASSRALSRAEGEALERSVRFSKVLSALKQEGVVENHTAWKDVLFYTAKPCTKCADVSDMAKESGFIGLVGVQEVLPFTSSVQHLVISGYSVEEIEADAKESGMLTMLEDALFKAVQGLVSIEEVVELAEGR